MTYKQLTRVAAEVVHWLSGQLIYIGGHTVRIAFECRRWAESHGVQP